jgi:N6-adenosine-specific RNA methylase IME4
MTRYRTIVADPPWRYAYRAHVRGINASAEDVYPTMTFSDIAAMPIADLVAPDAHLYMWITNTKLFDVDDGWTIPRIVEAWGFTYKTLLTWDKTGPLGMGYYFRGRTEHVVFATKGKAPIPCAQREQNIIHAPNGAHSAKPDAFYDLVERVSPGPYLELFARRARFGWDYWGDQSLGTADMDAA